MACSKQYMKQSMIRGNAPPRGSVLRDPEMVKRIGWTDVAAKAIETGVPTPADPVFQALVCRYDRVFAGADQSEDAETGVGRCRGRLAPYHAPCREHAMIARRVLLGSALAAPMLAKAQGRPDKLVFVGDNGPWHWCLVEEVAPAFEKATGIKIDFTLLPIDALSARLKAELNSGTVGIDVIQWTAPFAGWLSPHLEDHEKLLDEGRGIRISTGTTFFPRSAKWRVIKVGFSAYPIA